MPDIYAHLVPTTFFFQCVFGYMQKQLAPMLIVVTASFVFIKMIVAQFDNIFLTYRGNPISTDPVGPLSSAEAMEAQRLSQFRLNTKAKNTKLLVSQKNWK